MGFAAMIALVDEVEIFCEAKQCKSESRVVEKHKSKGNFYIDGEVGAAEVLPTIPFNTKVPFCSSGIAIANAAKLETGRDVCSPV